MDGFIIMLCRCCPMMIITAAVDHIIQYATTDYPMQQLLQSCHVLYRIRGIVTATLIYSTSYT